MTPEDWNHVHGFLLMTWVMVAMSILYVYGGDNE